MFDLFYMSLVFLMALLFAVDASLKNAKIANVFLLICFLITIVVVGLRDETGTDWIPYKDFFLDLDNSHMEVGFLYFVSSIKSFTDDYNSYVLIHTSVYLLILYFLIYRKPLPVLILLMWLTGHQLGWMGSQRQILSLLLIMLAIDKFYTGRLYKSSALFILAVSIHQSSLVFLFVPIIRRYLTDLNLYKWVLLIISSLSLSLLMQYLGHNDRILSLLLEVSQFSSKIHGQLIVYSSGQFSGDPLSNVLVLLKRLVFIFVVLLFIWVGVDRNLDRGIDKVGKRFRFYLSLYLFSILMVIMVQPVFPLLATRGGAYFYIYEIFLISYVLGKTSRKTRVLLLVPIIFLLSFRMLLQLRYDTGLLVPYKSVWINQEVSRRLY